MDRLNKTPSKQDRINRIAEALGSSAKTLRGIKKYFESNSFPAHPRWGKHFYSPEYRGSAEYASRKIGRSALLKNIARAVDAALPTQCMHSKYSQWSAHVETSDSIRYARSAKCRDLHYTNPCVRWVPLLDGGDVVCVIYTDRGVIASALTVPWQVLKSDPIDAAKVPGDVCTSGSKTRRTRWALDCKTMTLKKSGIAVKNADGTWEHADNMAGIAIARQEKARKIAEEKHSRRVEHIAKIIERLCKKIEMTYEDAKKLNYCDAGIQGFLRSIGLPVDSKIVTADAIPPSADHRWQPVRRIAALRIAQKIAA